MEHVRSFLKLPAKNAIHGLFRIVLGLEMKISERCETVGGGAWGLYFCNIPAGLLTNRGVHTSVRESVCV